MSIVDYHYEIITKQLAAASIDPTLGWVEYRDLLQRLLLHIDSRLSEIEDEEDTIVSDQAC